MQFNAPNGELNITDAVAITGPQVNITCDANVQGDLNLASGTGLYKKVAAVTVDSFKGDIAGGAASPVLTVQPNSAPNFIIVSCSAYLGTRTGESAMVSSSRNILFNGTVIGTLTAATIAAGAGDDVICAATTGFSHHLIPGVGNDYDSTVANTIQLAALSASGTQTFDSQHRIVVQMG